MKQPPNKTMLRDELAEHLRADLAVAERAHDAAREAATHEEARPEDDKDTRALEQSYLARGQATRVETLRTGLLAVQALSTRGFAADETIALGALVVAEDEGGKEHAYYLAPHGGGVRLHSGTVQVVTPASPLGRALLERRAGDSCEVAAAGSTREVDIVAVL
jgi:transcription elongation GreA/GreB family factor